jgi:hypothetical protein
MSAPQELSRIDEGATFLAMAVRRRTRGTTARRRNYRIKGTGHTMSNGEHALLTASGTLDLRSTLFTVALCATRIAHTLRGLLTK